MLGPTWQMAQPTSPVAREYPSAIAMVLITQAYRLADASLVTVFEYTGMIWAPLWGFLFFAEVPASSTFLGMLFILAAGLIVLIKPRRRAEVA